MCVTRFPGPKKNEFRQHLYLSAIGCQFYIPVLWGGTCDNHIWLTIRGQFYTPVLWGGTCDNHIWLTIW